MVKIYAPKDELVQKLLNKRYKWKSVATSKKTCNLNVLWVEKDTKTIAFNLGVKDD